MVTASALIPAAASSRPARKGRIDQSSNAGIDHGLCLPLARIAKFGVVEWRRSGYCRVTPLQGFYSLGGCALPSIHCGNFAEQPAEQAAAGDDPLLRALNQDQVVVDNVVARPFRATLMLPMTPPSFVCKSRTTIGLCQYVVGSLSSWLNSASRIKW